MMYMYCVSIGSHGSASHPVGHLFHPLPQPGVTQPGVPQLGVPQPGVVQPRVTQPGIAQLGVAQPRVTQPRVTQPGIAQPGVMQPGVMTQWRVVQQGALQLHNAPQHMTAGFRMPHSKFYTILSKCSIFIIIL